MKPIQQTRFQAGLCIICGNKPHLLTSKKCQRCFDKHNAYLRTRRHQKTSAGVCSQCGAKPLSKANKSVCEECRNKMIFNMKIIKDTVYEKYGGYCCTCCGETEPTFLSIDHIHNDGNLLRSKQGTGSTFYRWLMNHNFPKGYQVLCLNCQFSKHLNGQCVHKRTPLLPFTWAG